MCCCIPNPKRLKRLPPKQLVLLHLQPLSSSYTAYNALHKFAVRHDPATWSHLKHILNSIHPPPLARPSTGSPSHRRRRRNNRWCLRARRRQSLPRTPASIVDVPGYASKRVDDTGRVLYRHPPRRRELLAAAVKAHLGAHQMMPLPGGVAGAGRRRARAGRRRRRPWHPWRLPRASTPQRALLPRSRGCP